MQLSAIRRRDASRVRELLMPPPSTEPRSLVIQGLPYCGLKQVFSDATDWLRTKWASVERRNLVEVNLSNFWPKPVIELLSRIREDAIPISSTQLYLTQADLDKELIGLRDDIERFAELGGQTIFALDNFDALLKFSEPDQVQTLLNMLQSLGHQHQYQTAFLVCCHRDIEDICQKANYSDFYKIFGANHYRVSKASNKEVEEFIIDNRPQIDADRMLAIVALSAGYPEHAEFLLRFEGSKEEMRREALNALAYVFEEWISCLTSEELQVVQLLADGRTLGYEHLFAKNKLYRKDLILEASGVSRISSPLFESYLIERVGKSANSERPFIRRGGLIGDVHISLMEQLFQGKHYLEWRFLQSPTPDDATVYLVSGEDRHGVNYRPSIVKIHRSEIIDKEISNTRRARERLGSVVPSILAEATLKGQKAVLFEYATADNHNYVVHQFADFYRNQSASEVVVLVQKLFNKILWPFYQDQSPKNMSASRLYFLPRIKTGEFDRLCQLVRRSIFYDPACDGLVLPEQAEPLANPATLLRPVDADPTCLYYRLFLEKREAGTCLVHGDINPRNFLVDGIGNVHLIDFAAMKEDGGRYLDFARLEAEIKFKLTDISSSPDDILSAILFDGRIGDDFDMASAPPSQNVHTEQFIKMAAAASAIRHSARTSCQDEIDNLAFELEYKTALLSQTLRISLFEDYLEDQQKQFAILSAAILTSHLLNRLDGVDVPT